VVLVILPRLRGRGTAEGGGGGGHALDLNQHVLQLLIAQHLARGNAQHFDVSVREPAVAALIVPGLLLVVVR